MLHGVDLDIAPGPHLRVADNTAFGLRRRGVGKAEADKRTADALELVGLDHLADRFLQAAGTLVRVQHPAVERVEYGQSVRIAVAAAPMLTC